MTDFSGLKKSEKTAMKLRALYNGYGYRPFRMSNFEEYSFYLRNKNFLQSDKIIAFNDLDGRLMALKPDVTLSIVKNASNGDKFYYTENVYRPASSGKNFKEVSQTGLEAMGEIDLCAECEVILLACLSLAEIDPSYVIDLSHMGIVDYLKDRLSEKGDAARLTEFLSSKNRHDAEKLFGKDELLDAVFDGDAEKAETLAPELKPILEELRYVKNFLSARNVKVNIDFSLVNDENYYNGIIFRGYVEKVPRSLLSGGRYDKLMTRFGKDFSGIGFAVYLDELDVYDERTDCDCDVLLLQGDADAETVLGLADGLRSDGLSVRVERSFRPDIKCGKVLTVKNGKTEVYRA